MLKSAIKFWDFWLIFSKYLQGREDDKGNAYQEREREGAREREKQRKRERIVSRIPRNVQFLRIKIPKLVGFLS